MQVSQARKLYIHWLLVARDLSPHTIRAYDGDIVALERQLGQEPAVAQIDSDRLAAFIEQQRATGLCAASVKRRASCVRGFCRWLVAEELLEQDPSVDTVVAAGRTRRLPRIVPAHELHRLLRSLVRQAGINESAAQLKVLKRPNEATTLLAVAMMLVTGIRVHELVGLRCQDIDITSRSLRLLGKGRRERQVFLANDWIAGLTEAYIRTRMKLSVAHSRLLFNSRGGPMSTASVRSRLAAAVRAAGLHTRVTPHMLRHTAATQLIEAGVDIRYIQRLLGHASLSTTEIYTHISDRALKRVVADADVLGVLLCADN